ncbi:hypothetical protein PHYPSEUDO_008601 [Phytophthora pseudosyringae]|uniref:Uncharacterized protein n=1 Tax=Phytophthora pseudosyringae TaxID=221518 RepID=A0A8T1W9E0_9STRA|nr:hypothetical protein PHYPSEUDO_008601 [Phytophthora pseudosyringae]
MEGGRGGGRGKGKKGKKKAAAAAAAASHLKTASHPNVQAASAPDAAAGDQTMTKSKRKRLKKAAAAEAVKAAQPHAKKPPTAATSPKPKVAVLAPAPAAAVKPHVVSLTGGKKKKRKRGPVTERATLAPSGASPTAATTKTASPKRKLAQVQHAEKKENAVKAAGVAAKTEAVVGPRPRKTLKKVKPTAGEKQPAHVSKPLRITASPKATQPETATQKRKFIQVDDSVKKSQAYQQHNAAKVQANEKSYTSISTTSPTREVEVTSSKVATTKKKGTAGMTTAAIISVVSSSDKPAPTRPVLNAAAAAAPTTSSNPSHTAPVVASRVPSTEDKARPQKSGPSAATSATSASAQPSPVSTKIEASPLAKATTANPSSLPSGGLKRCRPIDQASANSNTEPVQPPAKRVAVASVTTAAQSTAALAAGSIDKQDGTPNLASHSRIQHTGPTLKQPHAGEAAIKSVGGHAPAKREVAIAASSLKAPSSVSHSSRQSPTGKPVKQEDVSQLRSAKQTAGKMPLKSTPERKPSPVLIQDATIKSTQPVAGQLKPAVKTEMGTPSTALSKGEEKFRRSPTAAKTKKVQLIMDSHTYVEKMMRSELETKNSCGNRDPRPTQLTLSLPLRPQNAWGASFGMIPPANAAPSTSRTLSTTPLSSWFLSKGCANFMKQVQFSDDDENDSSNSDDEDSALTRRISTPRGIDKASPKRKSSIAKKNAFLESLTTQSNWRTWYGNVDLHDLLDPPLAHVPEMLLGHEVTVTPLTLPESTTENEASAPIKKTSELERLEADIRQEKQRGSAFGEQLLMMLQGKTVSGKLLEEEYSPLLHQ